MSLCTEEVRKTIDASLGRVVDLTKDESLQDFQEAMSRTAMTRMVFLIVRESKSQMESP